MGILKGALLVGAGVAAGIIAKKLVDDYEAENCHDFDECDCCDCDCEDCEWEEDKCCCGGDCDDSESEEEFKNPEDKTAEFVEKYKVTSEPDPETGKIDPVIYNDLDDHDGPVSEN